MKTAKVKLQDSIVDRLFDSFAKQYQTKEGNAKILKTWRGLQKEHQNPVMICCYKHSDKTVVDIMGGDYSSIEILITPADKTEYQNIYKQCKKQNFIALVCMSVDPESFSLLSPSEIRKQLPEDYSYQLFGVRIFLANQKPSVNGRGFGNR